jgi:hypothetical protein
MYEVVNGPFNRALVVCHKCDNPSCVNPNHLFLGTYKDNMQDCVDKGRHRRGDIHGVKSHLAKLNHVSARQIFIKSLQGFSTSSIARLYGVSRGTAAHIIKRRSWKEATKDLV